MYRVNVAGRVNLVCFDKTGTLSEPDLDVFGTVPVARSSEFDGFCRFDPMTSHIARTEAPLLHVFASCHSLSGHHGKLVGDPLEVKMFKETGWVNKNRIFSYLFYYSF